MENNYLGFRLEGPAGAECNDGVVRRLQPDVEMVLDTMATLDLPPMESLSPEEARVEIDLRWRMPLAIRSIAEEPNVDGRVERRHAAIPE